MLRLEINERIPENRRSRKTKHFAGIPFLNNLRITINSIKIVKHYLNGTDSSEWLKVSEDNIYKRMKDGLERNR
jgi:hypothetical protein